MNPIVHETVRLRAIRRERRHQLLAGVLTLLLATLASAALAQTGAVLGFGNNASGQIGDSTTVNRSLITPADSISGIKAIACGYNHTLALDGTGTVWAWGNNGLGQLGTGDTVSHTTAVPVLYGIRAIAAGGNESMALDAGGNVYTWGSNSNGQLGQGDTTDRWSPTWVSSIARIKLIACGGAHSLFLSEDGKFYVCGWNGYGQLGVGTTTDIYTPFENYFVFEQDIKAIACGAAHTLIQYNSNNVQAAGYNADGELGNGSSANSLYFYNTGIYVRSIAAGEYHSLAVGLNGTALAWGANSDGQLGTHDLTNRYVPTQMPGAANVKAVVGGGYHTLVLQADGITLATGANRAGQLGDGTTTNLNHLVAVKSASFVGCIAAGDAHSILLKPFTKALATGYNNYGQLGIGNAASQKNAPVAMKIDNSIIAVSAGPSGWHSLLLRADGTVWACGDNQFGQLGNGTTLNSFTPVEVKGVSGVGVLSNIIAIAAGNFHSMALAADGTLYTWGRNSHGQLGLGNTVDSAYPVHVPGIYDVTAIAAGGYHSLLLGDQGSISGCGYNAYGQLGVGDTTDRSSFTVAPIWFGNLSVVGGGYHSLVLRDGYNGEFFNGQIMSFGLNNDGQLGTDDTTSYNTFTFDEGTLAVMMAGGNYHSLHLNAYGEVFGSGYNADGELGVGDTDDRITWSYNPYVQAIGIACGFSHSLFLDVYGQLYASGNGANGQLGNGSTAGQVYPTPVSGVPYTTGMAGGWGHTLILTAPPVALASLKISPASVVGGAKATGTVTLNAKAGAGGQRIALYADTNLVGFPAYVDVAPTSKTASFTITTSAVTGATTVYISAYLLNSQSTAPLTLKP
jgi:alpha-tubulin suppressor-like RCC1 family protein